MKHAYSIKRLRSVRCLEPQGGEVVEEVTDPKCLEMMTKPPVYGVGINTAGIRASRDFHLGLHFPFLFLVFLSIAAWLFRMLLG